MKRGKKGGGAQGNRGKKRVRHGDQLEKKRGTSSEFSKENPALNTKKKFGPRGEKR